MKAVLARLFERLSQAWSGNQKRLENLEREHLSLLRRHRVLNGAHGDLTLRFAASETRIRFLQKRCDHHEERIRELEAQVDEQTEFATLDHLTGLVNRRGLEWRFKAEESMLARTIRVRDGEEHRKPPKMAAIAIDLDYFKRVNDEYGGHEAGDRVLVAIAELMERSFGHRPEDILCRLGGDEFLVILPQADVSTAYNQALLFLEAVRDDEHLHFGGEEGFSVTASIGVTEIEIDPRRSSTAILSDLQRMADRATYRAKELGRNTIARCDNVETAEEN